MNKKGKSTDAPKGRSGSKTLSNSTAKRHEEFYGKSNVVAPERAKEILQQNAKENCETIKQVVQDITDATSKAVEKAYKMPQRVVLAMSIEQAEKFLTAMELADANTIAIRGIKDKEILENWNSIEKRIKKTLESHKGKEAQ